MSNDDAMSCDACGAAANSDVSCPYCHNARWCSVECRNGLGWSQHESSCNVMHELSELPSMPYAWQNAVANTGNTWDSQKEPFPAFLVRGPIDQHQLCFTQTVLPAIDKPPASSSSSGSPVKTTAHTFSLSLNGQSCTSEAKLRAPEHMICAESSQHAARTLAQSRAPRPNGKLYWVSERLQQQNEPVLLHVDDVNTFTLTRGNDEARHVSFHFDESAVDVYQEQVYAKLGYGLKQFLASQYRAKGLGTKRSSLSTHYALNPATGDTVVFTVDNKDATTVVVDAEYFAMDSPAPVRLQQQTFSVAPDENNPIDVQALCMAIEDRLDILHHDPDALELRTQLQSHLQTLLDHLHRNDEGTTAIGSDVENILAVRATINALHPLLWSSTQAIDKECIDNALKDFMTMSYAEIQSEVRSTIKEVNEYRASHAKSRDKYRRARKTKIFKGLTRAYRGKKKENAEERLEAMYHAVQLTMINRKWSQSDHNSLQNLVNSMYATLYPESRADPPVVGGPPVLTPSAMNAQIPDRQRVIPLKPIGAWIRQDTLRDGGSDKLVEWFDVDATNVVDPEARKRLTTRKTTTQNVVPKGDLQPDETFYYISPTNKEWTRSTGKTSGTALVKAKDKLNEYTFPLPAASTTPVPPSSVKTSSLLTEGEKKQIFDEMDEYLKQKANEEPSKNTFNAANATYANKLAMLDTAVLKTSFEQRFKKRVDDLFPTSENIDPFMQAVLDKASQTLSDAQYRNLVDLYNRLLNELQPSAQFQFKSKFYSQIALLNPQVTGTAPLPATPDDDDEFESAQDGFDDEDPGQDGGWFNAFKTAASGVAGASGYVLRKMASAAAAVAGGTYRLSKNGASAVAQAGVSAYEKTLSRTNDPDEAERAAERVIRQVAREQYNNTLERNPNYPHPSGFRAARDPSRASGGARNFRFVNASAYDDRSTRKKKERGAYFPYDESLMPNGPAGRRHYY